MGRFYGHVLIEFMDGQTERVGGNKHVVHDGQLIVKTEDNYSGVRDVQYFPLSNIRRYHWEGEK